MEQNIATAQVSVARPNWDKSRLVSRIVHLGCGAFHRAPGALYPSSTGKERQRLGHL